MKLQAFSEQELDGALRQKLQDFKKFYPDLRKMTAVTGTRMNTMETMNLDNLFPERLQRAAMEYFATDVLGTALLRQPAAHPGPGEGPDTESLVPSVARLLHRREQEQALSYRLPKRRNEFLAGRISARLALAQYWAAKDCRKALPEVKIINDSTGRPWVKMELVPGEDNLPPPEISISHGGAYGAALATDAPCGIDLQEQQDTLLRVRDKYCSAEEDRILADFLPEMTPPARLSLLWTAKEAAKKACSCRWMPGFLDLRLDLPMQRQDGWDIMNLTLTRVPEDLLLPAQFSVLATTINEYGLAVCILNEARHAGTAGS